MDRLDSHLTVDISLFVTKAANDVFGDVSVNLIDLLEMRPIPSSMLGTGDKAPLCEGLFEVLPRKVRQCWPHLPCV